MNDDELDELILGRLRQRAQVAEVANRTLSSSDLAVFFNEPEARVQDRLNALAAEGLVKESTAAPDRSMIALTGRRPSASMD